MTDKFLEDHAVAAGLSGTSAKGYAEAAKTIDRLIRQWISDFRNLIDKNSRDNAENIRIQLSDLHFVSDEFRLILNKVADGEVGSREVENLADMLQSTATDVNATLLTLKEEHRKFLNKRYGVGFWDGCEDFCSKLI